jgi:hypothetical protein
MSRSSGCLHEQLHDQHLVLRSLDPVGEGVASLAWGTVVGGPTHGRAGALSWQVATLVARVISSGVAMTARPAPSGETAMDRHQPS